MSNKVTRNSALVLSLLNALVLGYLIYSVKAVDTEKVVFIKPIEALDNYEATKEEMKKYNATLQGWKMKADSLQQVFKDKKRVLDELKENDTPLAFNQEAEVRRSYQALEDYMKYADVESEKEIARIREVCFKQMNEFIKEYAHNHNYKVILGASGQNNLLYAEEKLDVTEEFIKELNKHFLGQ